MGSISIREHIRWLPDDAAEPTSTIVLTSPQRRFVDLRILLSDASLEWGIAGTSSSWMRDDGKGGKIRHSQWKHWIDSRTTKPEDATDEGDMFPQSDGTTLETGSMVNPATGRETAYEELWRDVDPAGGCLVLHHEGETGRGSVVRLGLYCQGILREGDHITAERWEWRDGWERTFRIGEAELPCERALNTAAEVEVEGRVWRVVEESS